MFCNGNIYYRKKVSGRTNNSPDGEIQKCLTVIITVRHFQQEGSQC